MKKLLNSYLCFDNPDQIELMGGWETEIFSLLDVKVKFKKGLYQKVQTNLKERGIELNFLKLDKDYYP